jgi:hypothetical protein
VLGMQKSDFPLQSPAHLPQPAPRRARPPKDGLAFGRDKYSCPAPGGRYIFSLMRPYQDNYFAPCRPAHTAEGCELDNVASHRAAVCPQINQCASALIWPGHGASSVFQATGRRRPGISLPVNTVKETSGPHGCRLRDNFKRGPGGAENAGNTSKLSKHYSPNVKLPLRAWLVMFIFSWYT